MANNYLSIAQFFERYDRRTFSQLSNDEDSPTENEANTQVALDTAASELDSYLAGRYTLPLTNPPLILARWVGIQAAVALYGRRVDLPASLKADLEWADKWIEKLIERKVSLPNAAVGSQPRLIASEFTDGRSRFDRLPNFDGPPSKTSTSKGL